MPVCNKVHLDEKNLRFLPHDYIAGNCVQQSTDSFASFLKAIFPYYRSSNYEASKRLDVSQPAVEEGVGEVS
jgi:hypothetical protein